MDKACIQVKAFTGDLQVFSQAESVLLEPLMSLELVVPESHSARLLADLARRRADVQDIHVRHGTKVPLL